MMKKYILALLFFVIFLPNIAVSASEQANSQWPTYMQNTKRTGLSPYETNIKTPKIKWKFDAGHGIETQATIGPDGTIYFGTFKDNFYALDPDGKEKWRFQVKGEEFRSTPTIAKDGTIYFAALGKIRKVYNILHKKEMDYGIPKIYAFHSDGTKKWEFELGGIAGGTLPSPLLAQDGTIYIGSGGVMDGSAKNYNTFWAINPDGKVKWSFKTKEVVYASAALADDGTIYVACGDSNLYALDPDGKEKWRFYRETSDFSVFDGTPTIGDDGTIYLANTDKTLYAVSPAGQEKWNFKVNDTPFEATPTIGPDKIIYFGVIDQSEKDKNVYAVYPDGKLKWKFETGGGVYGSPAIDKNGLLFVGSYDHNLYSLSPEGKELWRIPTGSGIVVTPTIAKDGTIYFGSWDRHLYAIDNKEEITEENIATDTVAENKAEKNNFLSQNNKTNWPMDDIFILILMVVILAVAILLLVKFGQRLKPVLKKIVLVLIVGLGLITILFAQSIRPVPSKNIAPQSIGAPKK